MSSIGGFSDGSGDLPTTNRYAINGGWVDRDKLIEIAARALARESWQLAEQPERCHRWASAVIDALGIEQVGTMADEWSLYAMHESVRPFGGPVPVFRIRGIESGEDR